MSAAMRKPTPLIVLRSLVFAVWVYGALLVVGLLFLPTLLGPPSLVMVPARLWTRLTAWGLKVIVGARIEVRGLEHRPAGAAIIAAKHQGMLDIVTPYHMVEQPCFVLKKELARLPLFGWYCTGLRMIPVDREAGSKALRALVHATRERIAEGRQIVIFPEGTRKPIGAAPDYKPGVAALYREMEMPVTPMATNSGECWPAKGFIRYPGVVVFEFLPAIPPGLKRAAFMVELERSIETASAALLAAPH
ncbi:MAG: lysophospholipid acyltransferase family protein [Caulobacteraceae bacterium]